MNEVKKPVQLRLRVVDEDMQVLEALAGKTIRASSVASMLLSAAVQAVRDNQGRLPFPPALKVSDDKPGEPRT